MMPSRVFGAGNRPDTREGRAEATRAVLGDRERLRALVLEGLDAARYQSEADWAVIMGYCFGGTVALALARTSETEDVAGHASFHGNFPDGPEWPDETPPILVMHGGIDQNPSMQNLAQFVEEAEAAGLTYDVEIYSGADHAFTVFGSDPLPGAGRRALVAVLPALPGGGIRRQLRGHWQPQPERRRGGRRPPRQQTLLEGEPHGHHSQRIEPVGQGAS
jgi:dienelactone hydrolase